MNESNEASTFKSNNATNHTRTMPLHHRYTPRFHGRDMEAEGLEKVSQEEDEEQKGVEFLGEPTFSNTHPTPF